MLRLYTFPPMDVLEHYESITPSYMRPNKIPFAVIGEGFLSREECDRIVAELMTVDEHKVKECGAISRECGHMPSLDIVKRFGERMNDLFWKYNLDPGTMTWLQTYKEGGKYQLHMDAAPGRMRKLTAVAMLTDPKEYEGGKLTLYFHPSKIAMPVTQGTVVVFQSTLLHEVSTVDRGQRQTINMSFWGPPFK